MINIGIDYINNMGLPYYHKKKFLKPFKLNKNAFLNADLHLKFKKKILVEVARFSKFSEYMSSYMCFLRHSAVSMIELHLFLSFVT